MFSLVMHCPRSISICRTGPRFVPLETFGEWRFGPVPWPQKLYSSYASPNWCSLGLYRCWRGTHTSTQVHEASSLWIQSLHQPIPTPHTQRESHNKKPKCAREVNVYTYRLQVILWSHFIFLIENTNINTVP